MPQSQKLQSAKSESHLGAINSKSNEDAKSLPHSPARSSTVVPKANTFKGKKLAAPKDEAKTSAAVMDQTPLSGAAKSASSLAPPTNSRIPQRSPKTKTVVQQTPKGIQKALQNPKQSKLQPQENRLKLKETQTARSDCKARMGRTESLQMKRITSGVSKPKYVTENIIKCQSARSRSQAATSVAKRRSVSNMSARSGDTRRRNECDNSLRKIASLAGDHKRLTETEKNVNEDRSELVQTVSMSTIDIKGKIKICMDEWFLSLKNHRAGANASSTFDAENVQQWQILQCNNILDLIDDWCASAAGCVPDETKTHIEEENKSLRELEVKYKALIEQHKEELLQFGKDSAARAESDLATIQELEKKIQMQDEQVNALKNSVRNLENAKDRAQQDFQNWASMNRKLKEAEKGLKQELKAKNEIINSLKNELAEKEKLEMDLAETRQRTIQQLESKLEEQEHTKCVEHVKQISELSNELERLEMFNKTCQQRNDSLQQELNELQILKEKLRENEIKLLELQADCDRREKNVNTAPHDSKESQTEQCPSEAGNRLDIDKLKTKLSKAQYNICQLEQQIERDQQLLEVRSSLINSLQTNERTQRLNMDDLFAQLGEKNRTINELNCELQARSEEFRNLVTTLSAKQLDVANQERIIKLLEESNERSQMLRVKQEEKIGHLEEELARLKQIITIYQSNVLGGSCHKHLLLTAPALAPANMDYNENFHYYMSQRRRKRQVDINVKKYET